MRLLKLFPPVFLLFGIGVIWPLRAQQTEMKLTVKLLDTMLKPMQGQKIALVEIETRETLEAVADASGSAFFHLTSGDTWQIEAGSIKNYPRWRVRLVPNRIAETQRTLTYDLDRYNWDLLPPVDRNSIALEETVSAITEESKPEAGESIGKVMLKGADGFGLAGFPVQLFSRKQMRLYKGRTNRKGEAYFSLPAGEMYDIELEGMQKVNFLKIEKAGGLYYRSFTFEPMNFEETLENDTVRQQLPPDIAPTSTRQLVDVRYLIGGSPIANTEVHLKDGRGRVYLTQTNASGIAKYMLPMGQIYSYVVSKAGLLEEALEVIDLTYAFGIGSARRSISIPASLAPIQTKLKLVIPQTAQELNSFFAGKGLEFISLENHTVPYYSKSFLLFEDPDNSLNMERGLLMTTGSIFKAVGPNNLPGASYQNSPYLAMNIPDALAPVVPEKPLGQEEGEAGFGGELSYGAFDVCWLEFELVPQGSKLILEYRFASEEYPEYLNFDDAFGIFVEGAGVDPEKNWAQTDNSSNVSVSSVNPQANSRLYEPNDNPSQSRYHVWQYDGFTKKIQSEIPVVPGSIYRIKLLIFDRRDGIYDSGAFIEMRSE